MIGEQLAPFPLLAVQYPGNKVIILHGLWHFAVPLGQQHTMKGKTVAFLNDSSSGNSFPPLVQLNNGDFQDAKAWYCPDSQVVMDENHTLKEVLPIPEDANIAISTKIIPIPLFLVPLLLNGGVTPNTVCAYHLFIDEFFDNAPEILQESTQYIHDFLLAATGFDVAMDPQEQWAGPRSQLAINVGEVSFNAVIANWATEQFSGILHKANKFDEAKKAALQAESIFMKNSGWGGNINEQQNEETLLEQAADKQTNVITQGAGGNLIIRKKPPAGGTLGIGNLLQAQQQDILQQNHPVASNRQTSGSKNTHLSQRSSYTSYQQRAQQRQASQAQQNFSQNMPGINQYQQVQQQQQSNTPQNPVHQPPYASQQQLGQQSGNLFCVQTPAHRSSFAPQQQTMQQQQVQYQQQNNAQQWPKY